ncbi:MAG TPA: hypothetical protein VGR51_09975, partial [Thermoplasmata archaeon]|nr:hypothetical protein [Thermoplasmata archaeon]
DPAIVTIAQRDVTEGGRTWQFTGWSGDATGAATTVNLTMDGPRTVTANWREKPGFFSAVGGALLLVGLLLAVLFVILLAAMMRRRRKPAPSFQQMHPMSGEAMPPPMAPPATPPETTPPAWPGPPPEGPPP